MYFIPYLPTYFWLTKGSILNTSFIIESVNMPVLRRPVIVRACIHYFSENMVEIVTRIYREHGFLSSNI